MTPFTKEKPETNPDDAKEEVRRKFENMKNSSLVKMLDKLAEGFNPNSVFDTGVDADGWTAIVKEEIDKRGGEEALRAEMNEAEGEE